MQASKLSRLWCLLILLLSLSSAQPGITCQLRDTLRSEYCGICTNYKNAKMFKNTPKRFAITRQITKFASLSGIRGRNYANSYMY